MNEKIELTGVPETMLQTLYARAKESRTRGAIRDKKAEEVLSGLNYDFTLADSDAAISNISIVYFDFLIWFLLLLLFTYILFYVSFTILIRKR